MAWLWFERFRKWLSFDRIGMMHTHYSVIKSQIAPKGQKEQAEFDLFTREYERYHRKATRLGKWRWILYAFLYAAIFVRVLAYIPFLRFLAPLFELGNAVVGGGLAVFLIFLLSVRINLHLQRMEACMLHLVPLYHQNPKRDTDAALKEIGKVI
jgi:hypothetical protein